jgi:alpha-galactosidase
VEFARLDGERLTLSGTALMTQGLALPLTHPETAWLIALERLPA